VMCYHELRTPPAHERAGACITFIALGRWSDE
jgi:hypothetical protein